jgi:hypothetical protein
MQELVSGHPDFISTRGVRETVKAVRLVFADTYNTID